MKNLKFFSVLFVLVALVAISCSKGTTGPPGPPGPAGPDSVLHSKWIVLAMKQNVGSANDTFYTQNIVAPAITQRILDSGIVLSYLSIVDTANVTIVVNASVYFTSEIFKPQAIELLSLTDYSGFSYRYVVVPGTITSGTVASGPARGLTTQTLRNMSYSALEKLLSLSPTKAVSQ